MGLSYKKILFDKILYTYQKTQVGDTWITNCAIFSKKGFFQSFIIGTILKNTIRKENIHSCKKIFNN